MDTRVSIIEIKTCCTCNKILTKPLTCQHCRLVYYCNQSCQVKDRPKHKKVCKTLASTNFNTMKSTFNEISRLQEKKSKLYDSMQCIIQDIRDNVQISKCLTYVGRMRVQYGARSVVVVVLDFDNSDPPDPENLSIPSSGRFCFHIPQSNFQSMIDDRTIHLYGGDYIYLHDPSLAYFSKHVTTTYKKDNPKMIPVIIMSRDTKTKEITSRFLNLPYCGINYTLPIFENTTP